MNRPLNMLVIASDTYPPSRVDVSVLFGEELATRGHRIDWILQSEAACERAHVADWGGGKVWVGATDLGSSLISRIRKHALGIWNDLRVFPLLRARAYEIVEVKDKFIAGIFAALAARLYGQRFVFWLSYPFPEDYLMRARDGTARYPVLYLVRGTVFKWLLYGVLLRWADHVFVQSEQMRQDMSGQGIPLERMTVVPMGIRASEAQFVARGVRALLPENEPAVLYLGTLARLRHLEVLIGALAHIVREVPHAKLYLLGRGDFPEDERFLVDEAAKRGVAGALVMLGQRPRADALQIVREADVCVSPFWPSVVLNVASPTKLVEYMALGKAVVVNDQPEQRRIIEESGAGYWVHWDEAEFAAAIVKLLRAPDEARAMGERGREYVLRHRSYGVIADGVEQRLLEIRGGAGA